VFKFITTQAHGGDVAGIHVQVLSQRASSIFSDMETAMNNEQTNNALPDRTFDTNEVSDICRRYIEICTLLDGLFSIARTPTGEATEEILEETKKNITAVMVKWRDLRLPTTMPKIHAIEDHVLEQMTLFRGIGCYIEDFIEQAHQFGVSDESRTRGMKDRVRAANSHSVWEFASNRKDIANIKEEVLSKSAGSERLIAMMEQVNGIKKLGLKGGNYVWKMQF
jgi:hypothetical protein